MAGSPWPWNWITNLNIRLTKLEKQVAWLVAQEKKDMATLQDVQNAVASETSVVTGVTTLLQNLSQQLKDAIAAEDPAALQALVDQINTNANQLANAVAANTPGTPGSVTPAPAPEPAPAPAT